MINCSLVCRQKGFLPKHPEMLNSITCHSRSTIQDKSFPALTGMSPLSKHLYCWISQSILTGHWACPSTGSRLICIGCYQLCQFICFLLTKFTQSHSRQLFAPKTICDQHLLRRGYLISYVQSCDEKMVLAASYCMCFSVEPFWQT